MNWKSKFAWAADRVVCRRGLGAPQWWVVILLPVSNKKAVSPIPRPKLVFLEVDSWRKKSKPQKDR